MATLSLVLTLGLITNTGYIKASTESSYKDIKSYQDIIIDNLGVGDFSLRIDESNGNLYLAREIHQGLEFHTLGEGEFFLFVDKISGENYLLKGDIETAKMSGYLDNLELVHNYVDVEARISLPPGTSSWISAHCAATNKTIMGAWSGGVSGLTHFSRVQATSINSQGRATVSVNNRVVSDGGWVNNGRRSDASANSSPFGSNNANWDLRGRV